MQVASWVQLSGRDANQHVAKMVVTAWRKADIHAIPVSQWWREVVTAEEFADRQWLPMLISEGKPSMDSKYNPNGSVNADVKVSQVRTVKIIGKMGH